MRLVSSVYFASLALVFSSGFATTNPASADVSSFTTITWKGGAASPIVRHEAGGAAVGGKLYVFGGYIDTTYAPTARSDVYSPASNAWTRIADMPVATTHAGTAVDGSDVYFAGGYIPKEGGGQVFATRSVWKYDTLQDRWSSMPPLPQARGGGALALLGRELHFFAGSTLRRTDVGDHFVLALDGGTAWSTHPATLPRVRNHLGSAVIDDKIYAIGGQRGQDSKAVPEASVDMWDPLNPGSWTPVASLPQPRSHIAAATFTMAGRAIVIGGKSASGSLADVTAYDPATNAWTALTPLPVRRNSGVAAGVAGRIYYSTGSMTTRTFKGVPM